MTISDIQQQAEGLAKNEKLVLTKSTTEDKPPYIVIGNGKTSRVFQDDVVMDTLAVFASLSPKQQQIVILLRDEMIINQMTAYRMNTQLTNPNEIHLSHTTTDEVAPLVKGLLRDNGNGKILANKQVLRKVKKNVYMLNPFMFIPPYKFAETAQFWHGLAAKPTESPDTIDEATAATLLAMS